MRIICLILLFLNCIYFFGQTGKSQQIECVDEPAIFINNGGIAEFRSWILNNIKYPEKAITDSICGIVVAKFIVDNEGFVKNVLIVRTVRYDIDNVIIEAIEKSPKWLPAKKNLKNCAQQIVIPIEFDLKDTNFNKYKTK
jgi:TonB family protein